MNRASQMRERERRVGVQIREARRAALLDRDEAGDGGSFPAGPPTEEEWRCHQAFHTLTVAQRDRAWREIAQLRQQIITLQGRIEILTMKGEQ